ncbi:Hypothetical predicted protein, partial [Pelobates cultripes]
MGKSFYENSRARNYGLYPTTTHLQGEFRTSREQPDLTSSDLPGACRLRRTSPTFLRLPTVILEPARMHRIRASLLDSGWITEGAALLHLGPRLIFLFSRVEGEPLSFTESDTDSLLEGAALPQPRPDTELDIEDMLRTLCLTSNGCGPLIPPTVRGIRVRSHTLNALWFVHRGVSLDLSAAVGTPG